MFRKINKSQLTKIKQQNFIGIRAFDSRLYLDISKSSSSNEKNRLCIINVRRKAYKLKLNKMRNVTVQLVLKILQYRRISTCA